jgi:hypothetical protein
MALICLYCQQKELPDVTKDEQIAITDRKIIQCDYCRMRYSSELLHYADPTMWAIALDPDDDRITLERTQRDGEPHVIITAGSHQRWI